MNQPEKGPAYHTSEFMDGYYAGLNACSSSSSGFGDNNYGSIVNDPCNYYGQNICNENVECDSERFDCWSDCADGSLQITGQCPGDDKPLKTITAFGDDSLPKCDGSYQDCITERGDVCEAGSTAHECEIEEEENNFQEYETYSVEETECYNCYEYNTDEYEGEGDSETDQHVEEISEEEE